MRLQDRVQVVPVSCYFASSASWTHGRRQLVVETVTNPHTGCELALARRVRPYGRSEAPDASVECGILRFSWTK